MEDLLDKMKQHVEIWLKKQGQLEQAFEHAQQKQHALAHEKRLLQERHELAISQIERMLSRLKLLEKS